MIELNGCIHAYTIRIYYTAMLCISATCVWIMLNAKRICIVLKQWIVFNMSSQILCDHDHEY